MPPLAGGGCLTATLRQPAPLVKQQIMDNRLRHEVLFGKFETDGLLVSTDYPRIEAPVQRFNAGPYLEIQYDGALPARQFAA